MSTPDQVTGEGLRGGTDDGGSTERNVGGRETDESVRGHRGEQKRPRKDGQETERNVGG